MTWTSLLTQSAAFAAETLDDAVELEPEGSDVSPAWAMDGRTRAPEPRTIAAQTAAPKVRLAAELNR